MSEDPFFFRFSDALAAAQSAGRLLHQVDIDAFPALRLASTFCTATLGFDAIPLEREVIPYDDTDRKPRNFCYYPDRVWTCYDSSFWFDDPDMATLLALRCT